MNKMQMHHAHLTCGIIAHTTDRGVSSVAIRSLAIAAECLTDRREQEEVLAIFERIRKDTGWRVSFLNKELKAKWNWPSENAAPPPQFFPTTQAPTSNLPPAPPAPTPTPSMQGRIILNPLAKADFGLPGHPYQKYYQPPNQVHPLDHGLFPPPQPFQQQSGPYPYS